MTRMFLGAIVVVAAFNLKSDFMWMLQIVAGAILIVTGVCKLFSKNQTK